MASDSRYQGLRAELAALCARYPTTYWRELDQRRAYPDAFVGALTSAGLLGALIPRDGRGICYIPGLCRCE